MTVHKDISSDACPVPATLSRLRCIKPGERVVYYRGDMHLDIDRAEGNYRTILTDIHDEAQRLARNGVAKLTSETVERQKVLGRTPKVWVETVYVATGCEL